MKVYAVTSGPRQQIEWIANGPEPRMLMSYAYDTTRAFAKRCAVIGVDLKKVDLLLDSGAFTVWTKGGVIKIEDLIAWAKEIYDECDGQPRVLNLDVIPGEPRRAGTKKETAEAVKKSAENAAIIRSAGLPVIEVYHRGEPLEALEGLIQRRQPGESIGIGGGVFASTAVRAVGLDPVFAFLRDKAAVDGAWIPAHGLGISPESPLASRYPWYSIDASSWLQTQMFGKSIGRKGKMSGADSRTSNKSVVSVYVRRKLSYWRRLELEFTAMWDERGVNFIADGVAA